MAVNPLRERKRIRGLQGAGQGGDLLRIGVRAGPYPLKRRLRRIIAANQPRAHPLLAHEFHRGLEQILEEPQIRIQGIERGERRR